MIHTSASQTRVCTINGTGASCPCTERQQKELDIITRDQAISLGEHGGTLYHYKMRNANGTALRCRITGKCKLWKRDTCRFRLPVKYGLRDSFYIEESNAIQWLLYDPTDLDKWRKEANLAPDTPWQIVADYYRDQGKEQTASLIGLMCR